MRHSISYGPLTLLGNGKALLAGGTIVYSGKYTVVARANLYDPSSFAAKDAKQLTKDFYAEDAQLLPPHQDPVVGRTAIEQALETLIAGGLRDLSVRGGSFRGPLGADRLELTIGRRQ